MKQPLPCPHCAQPIGLDWRNVGLGGGAGFVGLCPACLQPYRFGARVRLIALGSMLAFAALGAVLAYAFQRCSACVRLEAAPEFALLPAAFAVVWLGAAVAAGMLGARLGVARAVRAGAARSVLVVVDAAAVRAGDLRVQPRTAIAAAVVLLAALLFTLIDEWRAIAARLDETRVPVRARRQLDVAGAAADPVTFWFFVAIEFALTALVLACLIALLRRTLKDRRARRAPAATSAD